MPDQSGGLFRLVGIWIVGLGAIWGCSVPLVHATPEISTDVSLESRPLVSEDPLASPPVVLPVSPDRSQGIPIVPAVNIESQPGAPLADQYGLTMGDLVTVTIANVPEFSGSYQVMTDGSLNLPVLGRLSVRGLTVTEVERAIASAYTQAQILVQPVVTVTLSQMSPIRVVIRGEVGRPGLYTLPLDGGRLPTVATALDQAGGITPRTDLQRIEVQRWQPNIPNQRVFTVSLWDILNTGDLSPNISLRDGDSIWVPTALPTDIATATSIAGSTLAADIIQVNIIGEVLQPGVLSVPASTPLNEALLLTGGFTTDAEASTVSLIRLQPDGTVSHRDVPVDLRASTNNDNNPLLQNRDVIVVGKSASATLSEQIGTILDPLNSVLSLFNFFVPFIVPSSTR